MPLKQRQQPIRITITSGRGIFVVIFIVIVIETIDRSIKITITITSRHDTFFHMEKPALRRTELVLGSTPSSPDPLSGVVPTGTKTDRPSYHPAQPGAGLIRESWRILQAYCLQKCQDNAYR